ncbi:6-phospho-3-hexuloisomerase [Methanotorris igneus]|uniref:6-phospho-3-hexuloisomerase n=1 Tax=Methanotorris igneus TaxID=2189 RepID=UPI00155B1431|nr:6-phospho-3-hexuloisomerase [Methanotorris igneus]
MFILIGEILPRIIKNIELLIEFERDENLKNKLNSFLDAIINAKNIFVFGVGRSGLVGKAFAMRLMHLGFNVYVVGETICPSFKKGDLLIAISGSGETTLTIEIAKKADNVVAITCNVPNTLAKISNIWIPICISKNEYLPLGTAFEHIAFIFLDIVVALLMERLGISEKEMKERHCNLQ